LEIFDAIVVGLGAMGSATAYQLAQRGKTVLGLEKFTPAHDQGSSHGSSRIIRQAYYEESSYVPLVLRAYELWERLQADTGADLLRITGGLLVGPSQSQLLTGGIRSAQEHGLEYEILDAAEMFHRFPQFVLDAGEAALYEPKAGYLRPEECILQNLAEASRCGAELRFEEPMVSWTASNSGEGVIVKTAKQTFHARNLVLSMGAWAPQILGPLGFPIAAYRKVMFWFNPIGGLENFLPERCPVYIWRPEGAAQFYGFPATDGSSHGVKVAIHAGEEGCTPGSIDRNIRLDDELAIRSVIATRIPALNGRVIEARTCMYTMTPDENFIIEPHPEHPQVSIATGFSGHGFKFSSVVGEILADFATEGNTRHNVAFLSSRRFRGSDVPAG
jgi:sarcosine oxidase